MAATSAQEMRSRDPSMMRFSPLVAQFHLWRALLDLPNSSRARTGPKRSVARLVRRFGATPGSWLVRGYVDAVERFREQAAIGADSPREVYPPLFEALNWAHSLWDTWFRLVEPQDRHLDGLRHVRDRCHHQVASAIYPDAAAPGGWRWCAIGQLPPEDPGRGHDREGAKKLHRAASTEAGSRDARDCREPLPLDRPRSRVVTRREERRQAARSARIVLVMRRPSNP
jgi:hypothetical protein